MPGGNLMDTSSTYFPTIKNWMSASPVSPYIFSSCLGNVPNTVLYGYHQAHSGTGFVVLPPVLNLQRKIPSAIYAGMTALTCR